MGGGAAGRVLPSPARTDLRDGPFEALRAGAHRLAPGTRSMIFLLVMVGFGSKAGLVPVHVWLPRAHPAAPSHVSALMSAVMVKLGLYGLLGWGWICSEAAQLGGASRSSPSARRRR